MNGSAKMGALVAVALLSTGCSSGWGGKVQIWGGVEDALHKGQIEGRVRVLDVCDGDGCVALGAAAFLNGEIIAIDGEALIAVASEGGKSYEVRPVVAEDEATILAAAKVAAWSPTPIGSDLDPDDFETYIEEAALAAGIDIARPFPFLVRGPIIDLEAHVVGGRCPVRTPGQAGHEGAPYRAKAARTDATLVGFFVARGGHSITHHGSRTHVHVKTEIDGKPFIGHVDYFAVTEGSTLLLPQIANAK